MLRTFAVTIAVSMLAVSSASAGWFEFNGWDDSLVNGSGQRFQNIYGDVDVLVRRTGQATESSSANGEHISIAGNSNSQTYAFNFSEPLDLIVEVHTLDPEEQLRINGSNPIQYEHVFGRMPTIDGSTLQGNAFGLSSDGVSNGIVHLGSTRSFLTTYTTLTDNKFEVLSVGTNAVPEPNPAGLIAFGILGLAALRRKTK